jgi:hypothetical protein
MGYDTSRERIVLLQPGNREPYPPHHEFARNTLVTAKRVPLAAAAAEAAPGKQRAVENPAQAAADPAAAAAQAAAGAVQEVNQPVTPKQEVKPGAPAVSSV